ncbi:hypothetical protein NDN08_007566 [Rhodosorus marinus]|uniref:glutathione gamma-glutamylcysteinyltransferase n=1 Tax=Rhodosorus marinus TaxID=101924 RepID=A0AAV8UXY3_9RHOD|nr:hypothetical protein NDN08_007566 [Rhodosorus marinus]
MPKSFYRRPLPSSLVAFSSAEGRKRFVEAVSDGTAESFFPLVEQFQTQSEPAYCGLTSLSVVLNALAIDPQRIWKGPWRWFSEELLDCCLPLEHVMTNGTTIDDFACIARCNGASAAVVRDVQLHKFRQDVEEICSTSSRFTVISFDRQSIGQTGSGHFSPIAAFHRATDSVLVLDVARFKYSPFWATVTQMYESMMPLDKVTKRPRGYVNMSRSLLGSIPLSCRLRFSFETIGLTMKGVRKVITPELFEAIRTSDLSEDERVDSLATVVGELINRVSEFDGGSNSRPPGPTGGCCKKMHPSVRIPESGSEGSPNPLFKKDGKCKESCSCSKRNTESIQSIFSELSKQTRESLVYKAVVKLESKEELHLPDWLTSIHMTPEESASILVLAMFYIEVPDSLGDLGVPNLVLKTEILALAEQIRSSEKHVLCMHQKLDTDKPKEQELDTDDPKEQELDTDDPKQQKLDTDDPKEQELDTDDPKKQELDTDDPKEQVA